MASFDCDYPDCPLPYTGDEGCSLCKKNEVAGEFPYYCDHHKEHPHGIVDSKEDYVAHAYKKRDAVFGYFTGKLVTTPEMLILAYYLAIPQSTTMIKAGTRDDKEGEEV